MERNLRIVFRISIFFESIILIMFILKASTWCSLSKSFVDFSLLDVELGCFYISVVISCFYFRFLFCLYLEC